MPSTSGIVASANRTSPAWASAWRTAWNNQLAGSAQAHIACFGDSLTQGYYATEPYYTNGWAGKLATLMNTRTGVTAGTGLVRLAEEPEVVDDRLSRTGTWTDNVAGAGFYGRFSWGDTGETLTFGPVVCDSFRILVIRSTFGGSWTATIDGGAPSGQTSNAGTNQAAFVTLSAGSLGSHTLVLDCSTGPMYVIAVEALRNTTTGVKVSRIGRSGAKAVDLNGSGNAYQSRELSVLTAPHLAIVGLGLNDSNAGTVTTFGTNLTAWVQAMKAAGSSVLMVVQPNPSTSWSATYVSGGFAAKVREIAASEATGLLDFTALWGGGYDENPSWYADTVHPNDTGHTQMANAIYRYVLDAVKG